MGRPAVSRARAWILLRAGKGSPIYQNVQTGYEAKPVFRPMVISKLTTHVNLMPRLRMDETSLPARR